MKEGIERENRKGIHDLHFLILNFLQKTLKKKEIERNRKGTMPCFIARKHNKKEEMEREIRKGTIPYFIAIKHNKKEEMEREIRKGIYAVYFEFFPRKLHNKGRNGREKSRNTPSPNLIAIKHPIRKRNGKDNRKGLMSWCVIYQQKVK
jgi:hypothetical protein